MDKASEGLNGMSVLIPFPNGLQRYVQMSPSGAVVFSFLYKRVINDAMRMIDDDYWQMMID